VGSEAGLIFITILMDVHFVFGLQLRLTRQPQIGKLIKRDGTLMKMMDNKLTWTCVVDSKGRCPLARSGARSTRKVWMRETTIKGRFAEFFCGGHWPRRWPARRFNLSERKRGFFNLRPASSR
jgi:hypothetical protein